MDWVRPQPVIAGFCLLWAVDGSAQSAIRISLPTQSTAIVWASDTAAEPLVLHRTDRRWDLSEYASEPARTRWAAVRTQLANQTGIDSGLVVLSERPASRDRVAVVNSRPNAEVYLVPQLDAAHFTVVVVTDAEPVSGVLRVGSSTPKLVGDLLLSRLAPQKDSPLSALISVDLQDGTDPRRVAAAWASMLDTVARADNPWRFVRLGNRPNVLTWALVGRLTSSEASQRFAPPQPARTVEFRRSEPELGLWRTAVVALVAILLLLAILSYGWVRRSLARGGRLGARIRWFGAAPATDALAPERPLALASLVRLIEVIHGFATERSESGETDSAEYRRSGLGFARAEFIRVVKRSLADPRLVEAVAGLQLPIVVANRSRTVEEVTRLATIGLVAQEATVTAQLGEGQVDAGQLPLHSADEVVRRIRKAFADRAALAHDKDAALKQRDAMLRERDDSKERLNHQIKKSEGLDARRVDAERRAESAERSVAELSGSLDTVRQKVAKLSTALCQRDTALAQLDTERNEANARVETTARRLGRVRPLVTATDELVRVCNAEFERTHHQVESAAILGLLGGHALLHLIRGCIDDEPIRVAAMHRNLEMLARRLPNEGLARLIKSWALLDDRSGSVDLIDAQGEEYSEQLFRTLVARISTLTDATISPYYFALEKQGQETRVFKAAAAEVR